MITQRALVRLMGVLMLVQVVLGIGLWTGWWYSLVEVHQTIGSVYVLLLWTIAIIALVQRRATGAALFAIAWGAVIISFGFSQRGILPGPYHGIIRVLHLLVGISAYGIAKRLVEARRRVAALA